MADYFSEYSSFIGHKGLPSPADTPYETPAFIRSKRSSRATTVGSRSRDHSESPPPLPPDAAESTERNGRYTALDPRRFTPTLHASLVAEILSLRRDLDSKNHLVENLESSLAGVKDDNDLLNDKLAASAKEVRVARSQVQQMESGTYEALETLANERNNAQTIANEVRLKLEVAQKKVKMQDDDAERTQAIWEQEKESWENERRQLERRIHVTETRLRTFVDEMVSQQSQQDSQQLAPSEEIEEQSAFTDSGLGQDDSDNESVKESSGHKRDISHASFKSSKSRASVRDSTARNLMTPEPNLVNGHSLADELDFADDDDDEAENADLDYNDSLRKTMESRQSNMDSKAKRVLGLPDDVQLSPVRSKTPVQAFRDDVQTTPTQSPRRTETTTTQSPRRAELLPSLQEAIAETVAPVPKLQYVDRGFQPSPPPSPVLAAKEPEMEQVQAPSIVVEQVPAQGPALLQGHRLPSLVDRAIKPISPPETPVVDEENWTNKESASPSVYADSATQTETATETAVDPAKEAAANRQSLQLPTFVPSIAIHPPTSRPSSPRPYVLPPHTKNADTQTNLPWPGVDAGMQTEEIRIDRRAFKLPPHLLPSYLTSPLPDSFQSASKESEENGVARKPSIQTIPTTAPAVQPPKAPSPTEPTSALSRDNSSKDLRSMPLKAIPLPKPTLAPAAAIAEAASKSHGPLNRSAQFGVSHDNQTSRLLANFDDSDASDTEEPQVSTARTTLPFRPPTSRFGHSEHPRNVPEDKELSPERRPMTTESVDGAAPAPSIASSREAREQQRLRRRPPPKLNTYTSLRSRSPSFGSAGSTGSLQGMPPYPIPTRSSSRQLPLSHSEGSYSPVDPFVSRAYRSGKSSHTRQQSLRKVQSSTSIRQTSKTKVSPRKGRRRMRSPDLTPVQSMAFDSPAPTNFPIPELPTPLQAGPGSDYQWGSVSASTRPNSIPAGDESVLINAIAATMVGEWMWKYIRKRKSFGVDESTEQFAQAAQDGLVDLPGIGTRHKRWVWLSPYERAIMWDSKQPMSGSALLGKKGRKLTIQSVIDVKDDTPLAKKPELETACKRSILILTPARALKFTTTSSERHALWMTALSFLAESNRMESSLPPLPLVPAVPHRAPPPPPIQQHKNESSSFGRANVRDSVGLAKGKKPDNNTTDDFCVQNVDDIAENDGADFPAIPRLYSNTTRHQRKRSNTSPRLPPPLSTLRSFSSTAASTSTSSNPYGRVNPPSSSKANVPVPSSHSGSRGGSVASPDQANFFEAMGTVRMEAFVDPNVKNGVLYVPALPAAVPQLQQPSRRHRGDSNLSTTTIDKRRAGYVFDENGVDPFKGF